MPRLIIKVQCFRGCFTKHAYGAQNQLTIVNWEKALSTEVCLIYLLYSRSCIPDLGRFAHRHDCIFPLTAQDFKTIYPPVVRVQCQLTLYRLMPQFVQKKRYSTELNKIYLQLNLNEKGLLGGREGDFALYIAFCNCSFKDKIH